jgi:predicted permease
MNIVGVFGEVLLPVIIAVAIGYTLRRSFPIDMRSLNKVSLYALTPSLMFSNLLTTDINGSAAFGLSMQMLGVVIGTAICSWIISQLLGLTGPQRSGFLLTGSFMNSGNFGLSITQFAFGAIGLQYALISFLTQSILGQTLAVYFASSGHANTKAALKQIFKLPLVYAAIIGLTLRFIGFDIQTQGGLILNGIFHGIQLLGNASIPIMLLILGMQLGSHQAVEGSKPLVATTIIRLFISVGIAYIIGVLVGLSGMPLVVGVIQAGMPTAVNMIVIAVEFDTWPEFVSSSVVVTTLASLITLTLLISVLR